MEGLSFDGSSQPLPSHLQVATMLAALLLAEHMREHAIGEIDTPALASTPVPTQSPTTHHPHPNPNPNPYHYPYSTTTPNSTPNPTQIPTPTQTPTITHKPQPKPQHKHKHKPNCKPILNLKLDPTTTLP